MVEFILPGSTTAFKNNAAIQRDGAHLHFGTLLREGQKRQGELRVAIKPGQGPVEVFARTMSSAIATLQPAERAMIPSPRDD